MSEKLVVPSLETLSSAALGYVSFLAAVFVACSLSVPLPVPKFKWLGQPFTR
jgi:hypothetical protein